MSDCVGAKGGELRSSNVKRKSMFKKTKLSSLPGEKGQIYKPFTVGLACQQSVDGPVLKILQQKVAFRLLKSDLV